jgi:peptide/nickel transport system permease protein
MDLKLWKRSTNRSLRWGLALLGLLALMAVFAEFLAPYPPTAQHRDLPNAPPTRLHLVDAAGKLRRPFVSQAQLADRQQMLYAEDRSQRHPLRFFVAGETYYLLGLFPCRRRLFGVDEPARVFILGSDALGRDVFSRLLYGGRLSLSIAAVALLISLPLALLVGSVSGFYGGRLDFICMRLIELFLALPALYLIIALRSALPLELEPEKVFFALVAVIALFGWASLARVVRGMALSLREREFVLAAVALGASDLRIIIRHILPHLAGFALTQAAVAAPGFMLAEVTLSYLGLGVQEPLPSWGNMLAQAASARALTSFWWNLAPGVAIFAASLAFHLLAEGLRKLSDPRSQSFEPGRQLW